MFVNEIAIKRYGAMQAIHEFRRIRNRQWITRTHRRQQMPWIKIKDRRDLRKLASLWADMQFQCRRHCRSSTYDVDAKSCACLHQWLITRKEGSKKESKVTYSPLGQRKSSRKSCWKWRSPQIRLCLQPDQAPNPADRTLWRWDKACSRSATATLWRRSKNRSYTSCVRLWVDCQGTWWFEETRSSDK